MLTKLCIDGIMVKNGKEVIYMKTTTEKKRLTISLAQEVYNKLEEDAMQRGLNKSSYLTTLIQNFKEERA